MLAKGKSAGPAGINMEDFIHSGLCLRIHLCLHFNMCILHGYLAHSLMDCIILPLLKNKRGDLSHINNYRAIAICHSFSKLLEACILDLIKSSSDIV